MKSDSYTNYLIPFYKRFPIAFKKGKDHWLWDKDYNKYLDMTSGIGVTSFGHRNKKVVRAIKKQSDKLTHVSNLFEIPVQNELAHKIIQKSFDGKVFFSNSGAEANEAAMKIARLYGNQINAEKNHFISLYDSFHGRTMATISLTGQEKYQKGLNPLLPHIEHVPVNHIESLEKAMNHQVCGIFLEAVQGEGGVYPLHDEYIEKVKELAEKYEALIIFDEVQTGIGRTGKFFGYQSFNIQPDILTSAKALGNGFPIGATVVRSEISERMPAGMHASTFGGNYLACSAGLAVMKQLNHEKLEQIRKLSVYFKRNLKKLCEKYPDLIREIRVRGLMIGIDFQSDFAVERIIRKMMNKNILTLKSGHNVLRLLPPFTLKRIDIDYFMEILDFSLHSCIEKDE